MVELNTLATAVPLVRVVQAPAAGVIVREHTAGATVQDAGVA